MFDHIAPKLVLDKQARDLPARASGLGCTNYYTLIYR